MTIKRGGCFNDDSQWDIDLKFGNNKESELVKIINGDKLEVKADRKAHNTGNIAVEIECYGKPSGISVSKAKHYAFVLEHITLIIETERLRSMLNNKDYWVVFGGDNNASKMVLIPIRDLIKYGQ